MAKFRVSYSESGKPLEVHYNRGNDTSPMWATLPFIAASKSFNPKSTTDQALLSEAQTAPEWPVDLSDRSPIFVIPQADWKKFRRGMWLDNGWKRLTKDTADRDSKEDLKIAAGVGTDDYAWLKALWDACVNGLLIKPTTSEIAAWNTLATNASMPISFGSDGKMILK